MVEEQVQVIHPGVVEEVEVTKEDVIQLALNLGVIQRLTSRTGKEYIRMSPYTYKSPTTNQLRQQLRFAEAAISQRGVKDTVRREDGTRIPIACQRIAEIIKAHPKMEKEHVGIEDTKFEEIYNKVRQRLGVG